MSVNVRQQPSPPQCKGLAQSTEATSKSRLGRSRKKSKVSSLQRTRVLFSPILLGHQPLRNSTTSSLNTSARKWGLQQAVRWKKRYERAPM